MELVLLMAKKHISVAKAKICGLLIVPHSKSGLVPRSSLLDAGQLGFWEVGRGGTIG